MNLKKILILSLAFLIIIGCSSNCLAYTKTVERTFDGVHCKLRVVAVNNTVHVEAIASERIDSISVRAVGEFLFADKVIKSSTRDYTPMHSVGFDSPPIVGLVQATGYAKFVVNGRTYSLNAFVKAS
ncbi:hypothetical protein PV797_06990 [Clostridiaceae bacterium M8S5]|nr:hypothetical protein PV797_06990 [Clostridiaceae bacterium M8S5]